MSTWDAKEYLMAESQNLVVNCTELAILADLLTWDSDKTEMVEEFARTKMCTGKSSISEPASCVRWGDSVAGAVPGIVFDLLSDEAVADILAKAEQNIRDPTAFKELTDKIEAAGFAAQTTERLAEVAREVAASSQLFSGGQAAKLVEMIPFSSDQFKLVTLIEQRLTGLTCQQVIAILEHVGSLSAGDYSNAKLGVLDKIKVNIVDGHKKAEILDSFWGSSLKEARIILQDVCVKSKNNPVFGVVKGDPIVIVVDKSGSMAAQFTLQEKSWTRNSFCDQELENVVNGLSEGSRFNIITYSSSANMVFPDVKYATEENKKAAIDAVRKVPASGGTNSQDALDLAYAMTTMPEQIYFLTDGKPNTPANTILASIPTVPPLSDIPVNGIVFILPGGDPVARQFMKDLADMTGGFFRAVEDDPEGTNDQTR